VLVLQMPGIACDFISNTTSIKVWVDDWRKFISIFVSNIAKKKKKTLGA
jgi:hypothetical protein